MVEPNREDVAARVNHYIKGQHIAGIAFEVDEAGIQKVDDWWRVPLRPDRWPEKLFEYYEALAEIEGDLQEKDHLNVLLLTGEPVETPV